MAVVAQVRPTAFGGVPRVWEKLKAGARGQAASPPALPRRAAQARGSASTRSEWFVIGAAPTPVEVLEFFDALGHPHLRGVGHVGDLVRRHHQPPGRDALGSVGKPIDGVELRIADDGELLVRGPLVMRGYRNQPEKTAETIDADGWLHTGDIARIDDDGFGGSSTARRS